jgi:hypothetical protein
MNSSESYFQRSRGPTQSMSQCSVAVSTKDGYRQVMFELDRCLFAPSAHLAVQNLMTLDVPGIWFVKENQTPNIPYSSQDESDSQRTLYTLQCFATSLMSQCLDVIVNRATNVTRRGWFVQKGSTRLRRLRKESNSQSMNMQKRESRHCES